MLEINPKELPGDWEEGFALDYHTLRSVCTGYSASGWALFDTTYSEVGQCLHQLKYGAVIKSVVSKLADTAADFINSKDWPIDLIVSVPPSKQRRQQPVILLAEALGKLLDVDVCLDCVEKVRETPELKDIEDFNERMAVLDQAFSVNTSMTEGKTILLFDDLFRSGATLETLAECLLQKGQVRSLYALTMTKTRVHR